MEKVKAVILGYGDRGSCYATYAEQKPGELKIIGVIDTNPFKLEQAKKRFGLEEEQLYSHLQEFITAGVSYDVVINGTMDQMHYETSMLLLEHGYNMLLEKPITTSIEQLLEIEAKAKEKSCKVVVCHVLRYTPFYSKIKNIIASGKLGAVVNLQLNEHAWFGHFVNAFVRGKWRNESECGSGLLLQKSCHDTDLMCWLNNATMPKRVSSFGSRSFFTEKNAPDGATQYCYECPNQKTCMFNAEKFQIKKDFIPFYTWAGLNKPLDEITEEEKREFLKTDVYGQCVYKTDMDIVDRQSVSVEFENGSIGTLNLVGATSKPGRHIHIICEYGEIVGCIEENRIHVFVFDKEKVECNEEIIDLGAETYSDEKDNSVKGHYGGDYFIMQDLVRYLSGGQTSLSTTTIEDSVNSHLICFAAEKSRKEGIVVEIERI